MHFPKRPRLAGFDYLGKHRYFLTFCTHDRRRIFETSSHVALVSGQILRTCREQLFEMLAYVYMPDHLHLLVRLQADDLSRAVGHLKARVAHEVDAACGRAPPLWARGFHDHALRRDENTLVTARYILANPLRAGLVGSVRFYPYWHAAWL